MFVSWRISAILLAVTGLSPAPSLKGSGARPVTTQPFESLPMSRRSTQCVPSLKPLALPLEPLTVRIPVAVQLTGIGRSKLYELIAAGEIETAKVGASTLIAVASLRRLIHEARR